MDRVDELHAMADIAGSLCELQHHDNIEREAVDAIVVPIGYQESEGIYVQDGNLTIPICGECAESLNDPDDEFVLLYCLSCNASQWIYLPLARRDKSYYKKINWLKECCKCLVVKTN